VIIKVCWAFLGLLHAMPALALFRPALLEKMYGVAPGTDSFTLLHHRAALFLVVVVISVWAMLRPEVRALASIAVGISMVAVWRLAGTAHDCIGRHDRSAGSALCRLARIQDNRVEVIRLDCSYGRSNVLWRDRAGSDHQAANPAEGLRH
jgi:hypothetical protein